MPNLPPVPVIAPAIRPKSDRIEIDFSMPSEPEERPVTRVVEISLGNSVITHGGKALSDPTLAAKAQKMPGAIVQELGQAGTVATSLKSRCGWCVNWDQESGQRFIAQSIAETARGKAAPDIFKIVQNSRGLEQMGYCKALSAAMGKLPPDGAWITPEFGGCPAPGQVFTPTGEDVASLNLFKQRDRITDKRGATAYEMIMRGAQGKKP